jgi:hypothetical protein
MRVRHAGRLQPLRSRCCVSLLPGAGASIPAAPRPAAVRHRRRVIQRRGRRADRVRRAGRRVIQRSVRHRATRAVPATRVRLTPDRLLSARVMLIRGRVIRGRVTLGQRMQARLTTRTLIRVWRLPDTWPTG